MNTTSSDSSDFIESTRAEMRSLETDGAGGWDAGDGIVIFNRFELRALRRWSCFEENPPGLIVHAVRTWARRIAAAHRKRRILDWLIGREAKARAEINREVAAENADRKEGLR